MTGNFVQQPACRANTKGSRDADHRTVAVAVQAVVGLRCVGTCGLWGGLQYRLAAKNAAYIHFSFARTVVLLTQAVTQLRQQRVVCGERQVINFYLVRVAFAARSADSDEVGTVLQCPGSQGGFSLDLIASIQN